MGSTTTNGLGTLMNLDNKLQGSVYNYATGRFEPSNSVNTATQTSKYVNTIPGSTGASGVPVANTGLASAGGMNGSYLNPDALKAVGMDSTLTNVTPEMANSYSQGLQKNTGGDTFLGMGTEGWGTAAAGLGAVTDVANYFDNHKLRKKQMAAMDQNLADAKIESAQLGKYRAAYAE